MRDDNSDWKQQQDEQDERMFREELEARKREDALDVLTEMLKLKGEVE